MSNYPTQPPTIMSSLPKLNVKCLLNPVDDDSLVSPITPAVMEEDESPSIENEPGRKHRRTGGLSVSALLNEKDEGNPASHPVVYQPSATTEPPGISVFPSILYQEFITVVEDRSMRGTLPSLKSLGLPTCQHLSILEVSTEHANSHPRIPKADEIEATGNNKTVEHGKNRVREESEKGREALNREGKRTDHAQITTPSEMESFIKALRDREQRRNGEATEGCSSEDVEKESQASPKRSTVRNSGPGASNSSKVSRPGKYRRGRPNGDDRPRAHVCPICQMRFLQQSGVVSHYRVVHLKEKRFECTHKCGLWFGARGDVTRHVDAVHNKLRNFECQVCGDAFARKSILTRHCKSIHNDIFGTDEAHDCVHGCVRSSKKKGDEGG